jgi:hypothetical protein
MITKIINNKFVITIIIPLILLFLWIVLTLVYNSDGSISVLTHRMNRDTDKISTSFSEIYKEQKINGEFKARENNLGIVSVRFSTFKRINDDILIFRIKEKGENKWFYENRHKVDQFQPDDYFTFGFPIISDSEGRIYEFQLESTIGEPKNAVAISNIHPIFVTKYQFGKKMLLADMDLLKKHLYKKYLNTFYNLEFFISSIIYLFPFLFYVLWLYPIKPYVSKYGVNAWIERRYSHFNLFLLLIVNIILLNIFFVQQLSSVFATLILVGIWIMFSIKYKLDSSVTFMLSLLYLLICPILFYFNNEPAAERSIVWMYYFFIIGLFLYISELNKPEKNLHDYKFFLRKIFKR